MLEETVYLIISFCANRDVKYIDPHQYIDYINNDSNISRQNDNIEPCMPIQHNDCVTWAYYIASFQSQTCELN